MPISTSWARAKQRPPKVTIRVCDSLSCMLAGAERLLGELAEATMPGVRVLRAPCIGSCDTAPAAEVGHRHVDHANVGQAARAGAARGDVHPEIPAYQDFDAYAKAGGYAMLRSCLSGARKVEDVIAALSDGGLRGLGGAGFPDGPQMGPGARREGPAPDGGQRRRGRARHLQGPLLPRARAAQVPGGRADRRVGRRGRAGLHLHPRRIPSRSEDPRKRDRRSWRRRAFPSTPSSPFVAAPAPISAAKKAP